MTDYPPIEARIHQILAQEFSPNSLIIENQSLLHAGHHGAEAAARHGDMMARSQGKSTKVRETHFLIQMQSEKFIGLTAVARHRLVHEALRELLRGPIHALSLELSPPS